MVVSSMPVIVSLWSVAAFLALCPVAIGFARRPLGTPLVYAACLLVSLELLLQAIDALVSGVPGSSMVLPLGVPWIGMHFRLDVLSTFFLAVINLGGAAASLYALGYGRHETAAHRVLPFYPAFLAAMNLVIVADDAFSFLLSWEAMSLASWALVMAHHRVPDNARAGYVYILMASAGTTALLLAFSLLAGPDGGYAFDTIREHHPSGIFTVLVLCLALIGAGSKAGLVPLHVWLPLAHPAAPSHVSGLMSGVMTKVAVYGFIRIVFDLLGPPDWWWGLLVLAAGAATAVLGVLYAIIQTDLKRVLAYSTIENIGFIFIGLGLALAFQANQMGSAAALAFTAALFHVFNHALYKTLLFFGAGAVLTATGERDMEHLGGLIHRMPQTAVACLAGSIAIAALPPLNGFVSEWLILQAVLESPDLPQWGLKIFVPAAGATLALAAALAAVCFVRAFGVTFLGRPRLPAAAQAKEVDGFSRMTMLGLAALCLLVGILPGPVIDALSPVSRSIVGTAMPPQIGVPWLSIIPIAEARSSYNGLLVFVFMMLSGLFAAVGIHRLASRKLRRAPAWDCGFPDPSPVTQYSAGSFAQPIRRVFGRFAFNAREEVEMPAPGDISPARLRVHLHDIVWDAVYAPISGIVGGAADRLNALQFLTIRRYLSFVFFSLIALLLVLAIWS
ncbi:MAG TPA: hydrogenase 4 subunit B [Dongiaceae bacterium]|nr:hydrogenase 4 subunit B [Dongiaceae bacterium]